MLSSFSNLISNKSRSIEGSLGSTHVLKKVKAKSLINKSFAMKNLNTLLVSLMLLISCNEDNESVISATNLNVSSNAFESIRGKWELVRLDSQKMDASIVPPTTVTLEFESDLNEELKFFLGGNASCNQYGGELLKLDNNTIDFVQLYATEALCTEPGWNEFETVYFNMLFDSTEYSLSSERLTLANDKETLLFTRAKE
jgi:heat shock protein HslJ